MKALLQDFIDSGSPATPGYTAPGYRTGAGVTLPDILNDWNALQLQLAAAQNLVNDANTRLTALSNAVSGGSVAAFVAGRYSQVTAYGDRMELIREWCAASAMATAGPALVTALTAAYLTPVQTAVTNFSATYAAQLAQLHAMGKI